MTLGTGLGLDVHPPPHPTRGAPQISLAFVVKGGVWEGVRSSCSGRGRCELLTPPLRRHVSVGLLSQFPF